MRPLRFVLLIFCFIAIPVFLTCISLIRGGNEANTALQYQQRSRLRALFSFSTPSSLFPPSAIISLTTDNSTFFVARPAAFGPSLPSKGLSGRLWVGRGFGDDSLYSDQDLTISGFELGCSDVPGWGDEQKNTIDNPALSGTPYKKPSEDKTTGSSPDNGQTTSELLKRKEGSIDDLEPADDGTDDHLHRPLPDSNPATQAKPGEPANANARDKTKKPTHADIESLQESADIAGKIVLLSRGGCGFLEKVKWAQRRGGIAVIVGDNERNAQLTIMYAKGDTSNVTIPAIFTSYTSAHLLSSLVPPELQDSTVIEAGKKASDQAKDFAGGTVKGKFVANEKSNGGPVFTTTLTSTTALHATKPTSDAVNAMLDHGGWMQNVLHAVGLNDGSMHGEDSRRPPGSGNIEWVQVKDWDEEVLHPTTTGARTAATTKVTATSTKSSNTKSATTGNVHVDDFVIGVQDWRDTEVIAPKPTTTTTTASTEKTKSQSTSTTTGSHVIPTALKGGSIIPGSGEYESSDAPSDQEKVSSSKKSTDEGSGATTGQKESIMDRIRSRLGKDGHNAKAHAAAEHSRSKQSHDEDEGLWVTLTPANVSTSPFFDTLLVLVVSPLVTLTFVYGLLLLRSRIRRRRWRAPKSVVERLPVRTYQTMSTTTPSSTSTSHLPSPARSMAGSPQLRPEPLRARQRSQTTIGVLNPASAMSLSPPAEDTKKPKAKKYRGRQIECVVCLEEYIDGESKVMSLPCGHEFHADCITPWLVNRRRTCPICKGDVVRSLARSGPNGTADEDETLPGEETSDDVQERAATTVADPSAAIAIPENQDVPNLMDEDVERGGEADTRPSLDTNRTTASRWRGVINASAATLSGDTVWRSSSVNDRNR